MIRSLLFGLLSGSRSFAPLALVSIAARRGALGRGDRLRDAVARPMASNSLIQLAAAEIVGDKLPGAPDRIVPAGLAARAATGAVAGAALADRERRWLGALLGAGGALLASYPSFRARKAAIERFGPVATGVVEDAGVIAAGAALLPR